VSNILAIETSIPEASLALTTNGSSTLAVKEFESHRQQNKLLLPALRELLYDTASSPDLIIVGTGPGSYSGSRIAIAAAQGLGIAYGCPVIGLCSFLATSTLQQHPSAYAIGNARRGSYFIASVHADSAAFQPELMDEASFVSKLSTLHNAPLMSFETELPLPAGTTFTHDTPTASRLISAWRSLPQAQQSLLQSLPPQPAYLRAPFISKAKPGHPLLRNKTKHNP